MRVIITAGGTGGHIYPALAIIDKIKEKEKDSEFLYIGTKDRMEKNIVPAKGIPFVGIDIAGYNRKFSFSNIKALILFLKSIQTTKQIIKDFEPDVVIGTGGYVTAPVIYSAKKLGVPCFIHEQNSTFGMTNRFLERYVDKIFVSFKESVSNVKNKDKVIYTGNPSSESASKAEKADKTKYNLNPNKQLVLFVMGSLGSYKINSIMKDILPSFNNKKYEVMFVTGNKYYDEYKNLKVSNNIKIVPYIDNIVSLFKSADVLVSRAGATTLSEIIAVELPSILVPSPYVTENHQYKNAMNLVNNNAAALLEEKNLNLDSLTNKVEELLLNKEKLLDMKKNLKKLSIKNSSTKIYKEIKLFLKKE